MVFSGHSAETTVVNTGAREYHTTLKGVRAMVLNATFNNISIDRNDFDVGFLITFRKKYNFTLQKAMIFGHKITIIIITIIKHRKMTIIFIKSTLEN
jgi:hypothetical protein